MCEIAHELDLLGALDVFVRDEVVHDERYPALVKNAVKTRFVELSDGYGARDVVGEDEVELRFYELSRRDLFQSCVIREDLLGHSHSHWLFSFILQSVCFCSSC